MLAGLALAWGSYWALYPVPTPSERAADRLRMPVVVEANGTTRLGECLRFERGGIRACNLSGSPWERGIALARLFPRELEAVERAQLDAVAAPPFPGARWLTVQMRMVQDRRLAEILPNEIREELAGLALAAPDRYPRFGRPYTRWLGYLLAPALENAPLGWAHTGGIAFSAAASATVEGRPLLARAFDWTAGEAFDRTKLVWVIRPNGGHVFLSVGWPGMLGVVSGLNDAGLAVVLLPGKSADAARIGLPAMLVARQVLTEAGTLAQAEALIKSAQVCTTGTFYLGSGPENAFVIVEKTPQRTVVRPIRDRVAAAGDFFLSAEFKDDPISSDYRRSGPPEARLRRLNRLLETAVGKLDVPVSISLLRDRRGPEGEYLGLGNRLAINSLRATHAVVFDLGSCTAWVAASPHQIGEFIPFSLEPEAALAEPIPADPLLAGEYLNYRKYLDGMREGERLLGAKRYQEALSWLLEVRPLNPQDYRTYLLAGRALQALRLQDEARYNFERAHNLHPAFTTERVEADRQLRLLEEREP